MAGLRPGRPGPLGAVPLPILHPPPDGTWAQRGKTPSYSPRTGSAARSTPVRFLAALDNVLLAHHDRRRIVTDEQRKLVFWPDSTPWDCSGMSAGRSRS